MTNTLTHRIPGFFVSMIFALSANGASCLAEGLEFTVSEAVFEETHEIATRLDFGFAADRVDSTVASYVSTPTLNDCCAQWIPNGANVDDAVTWAGIGRDYPNFYRRDPLIRLGVGFGVGALMANTGCDREIHRRFQASVRNANSDDWFEFLHANKELGNSMYTVPVVAAAYAVGELFHDSPLLDITGEWGERSLRGYIVGVPHLIAFQLITGGSRPGERSYDSDWRPFADDNSVSGHGFIASLPFITAAKMTDRPMLKGSLYFASCLGPLSRVNDDAHYPSQAFLGWWVAYAAASAVAGKHIECRSWRLRSYVDERSTGIAAEAYW